MSKALEATCENGVVKVGSIPVDNATILSAGKGPSSGVLLMEQDKSSYHTSNATDLEQTIEKVVSSINKIADILTAIGSGMQGPATAPPPTLTTDVQALKQVGTELNELKGKLK